MVGSIIGRTYKSGNDSVKLALRIVTPSINNAIALDIVLDQDRWENVKSSLKYYMKAYRRGSEFEVDGSLKSRLWNLLKAVDAMNEMGTLSLDSAKAAIQSILRAEACKEAEKFLKPDEIEKEEEQRTTLNEWIESFISQCESGERLKRKSAKQITDGTIRSYKGTQAQLKAYQQKRHKVIDFDDVTLDFYEDWRRFFLEKTDKYGKPRPYSLNTIGRHVKNLKIFLYAAKDMKLTTNTDFESSRFSVDTQDVENVYLTADRVQKLYIVDFEDDKTVKRLLAQAPNAEERSTLKDQLTRRTPALLNEAKDIFVVGCLTGQRVSDYKRINENMFKTLSDGNEYIQLQQEKTGKWVLIPLDLRVRVILNRYNGKLPPIYDQDLNERIKVVGRLMGWRENAGIRELHGTMEIQTNKMFYECIKTHTARRTFATNAYKRGISLSSIMTITGHSSEKMLRKYLKLDDEEKAILAAAEFAKAKEVKLKIAK